MGMPGPLQEAFMSNTSMELGLEVRESFSAIIKASGVEVKHYSLQDSWPTLYSQGCELLRPYLFSVFFLSRRNGCEGLLYGV